MGRGHGGYKEYRESYRDSGNHKVTDKGAIFIAERYIDEGYESVFRRRAKEKSIDLTIKTTDDTQFVKNIEVKTVFSSNPSQMAKQLKYAKKQIKEGETVVLYLPNHRNTPQGREFVRQGIEEAKRKGYLKGPVEAWFSDKTKLNN